MKPRKKRKRADHSGSTFDCDSQTVRDKYDGGTNISLIFGNAGLSQFHSCPNEPKKESADSRQDRNRRPGNRSDESANNCP